MDGNEAGKFAALCVAAVILGLSFVRCDGYDVGIYAGCGMRGRCLYPFFHAGVVHAALNVWCLLVMVFYYEVRIWRAGIAYLIAVTVPADTLGHLVGGMDVPTVGLSGVIFGMFGMLSFGVRRKAYYQCWMACYLLAGFASPATNAWVHLYCYLAGVIVAWLDRPLNIGCNGRN